MSLQEKLKQKESGLPSVTQKMKEIEQQNELLLFRMKEINELVESTIRTSNEINGNHEIKLSSRIEKLNAKIDKVQESNELLSNNFRDIIFKEMNSISHDLKQQNDNYLHEIQQKFKSKVNDVAKITSELHEQQQKQLKITNNMQFYLTTIMYVVVAIVLVKALFFGVWEGLYVKNIYEWGSQWQWLKYTMIGSAIIVIGYIGYIINSFNKEK